jgi:hypothetical protein
MVASWMLNAQRRGRFIAALAHLLTGCGGEATGTGHRVDVGGPAAGAGGLMGTGGAPLNPTGSCTAPNSGARVGAPPPGAGDVWLPDCNLGLAREYWRVFVRPAGTAYILPDPRLPPQSFIRACADPQHPLYDIVTRYSFCNSPATNRPMDAMTPADALTVAHYYHRGSGYAFEPGLLFGAYAPGIVPQPFLEDVLEACGLGTVDDSSEFPALCKRAQALLVREAAGGDSSPEANLIYEGQAGEDAAYLLNRLYGIDTIRGTLPIDPGLCGLPSDAASCRSSGTRYFYNPASAACEPRSYGTCESGLANFPTEEACRGACRRRAQACRRCDDAGMCAELTDCSQCPLTVPDTITACENTGVSCSYGGHDGVTCDCEPDGNGGVAWRCTYLL